MKKTEQNVQVEKIVSPDRTKIDKFLEKKHIKTEELSISFNKNVLDAEALYESILLKINKEYSDGLKELDKEHLSLLNELRQ